MEDNRIEFEVSIERKEILYDVKAVTAKTARANPSESPEADREISAGSDDMDNDILIRSLNRQIRRCKDIVSAYLAEDENASETAINNRLQTDESAVLFGFCFPDNWNGSKDSLRDAIHEYLVDATVYEFMKASSSKLVEIYAAYTADAESQLKRVINKRKSGSVRLPMQPF